MRPFAHGGRVLGLIIKALQPSGEHLSGALQILRNPDVDEVASKNVRAEPLLAHQSRKHIVLKRDRRLPDGLEDAAREVVDAGIDQARAAARLLTKPDDQPMVDLDAPIA